MIHNTPKMPPKQKGKTPIQKLKGQVSELLFSDISVPNEPFIPLPPQFRLDKQKGKAPFEKSFSTFLEQNLTREQLVKQVDMFNSNNNMLSKSNMPQMRPQDIEQFSQIISNGQETIHIKGKASGLIKFQDDQQIQNKKIPRYILNVEECPKDVRERFKKSFDPDDYMSQYVEEGMFKNGFVKIKKKHKNVLYYQQSNQPSSKNQIQQDFIDILDDENDIETAEMEYLLEVQQQRRKRIYQQSQYVETLSSNYLDNKQLKIYPQLSFALQAYYNKERQSEAQQEQGQYIANQINNYINKQHIDIESSRQTVSDYITNYMKQKYGDGLINGKYSCEDIIKMLLFLQTNQSKDDQAKNHNQDDVNSHNQPHALQQLNLDKLQEQINKYEEQIKEIDYRRAVSHKQEADKTQLSLAEQSVLQESIIELGKDLNQQIYEQQQNVQQKQLILDILACGEQQLADQVEKIEQELVQSGNNLMYLDKKANQMHQQVVSTRQQAFSSNIDEYKRWEQLTIAEWNSKVNKQ